MSLYDPSPVQQEFHALTTSEALLGGAAGPGKSLCLLLDPVEQIVFEHGRFLSGEITQSVGWALHLRREFPRLEQTIVRAHKYFRVLDPAARYDSKSHTFIFTSGYRFQFGHIASNSDLPNYQSNEYTHIAFDELTEFEEEQYRFITTRLRTSDDKLRKMLRVRCATNPIGEGVMWVRKYFVEPAPEGRKILRRRIWLEDAKEWAVRTRIYIPATLKDNPIPEFRVQYEAELRDKPPHIREALLNANWYVVANAFYAEEFQTDVHVKSFKKLYPKGLPSGWTRGRSMDWGYKSWCVVLYWAIDPDNNIWIFRELSYRKLDAAKVADKLIEVEKSLDLWDYRNDCSKIHGPADNQIREQRGSIGETIDETFRKKGIFWDMATKNRAAAVNQFRSRLNQRSGEDQDTPGILFDESCIHCKRTIPAIPTDPADPELPADGGDDHWLDTVHYTCMSRPYVPDSDEAPPKDYDDELAEYREKKKRKKEKGASWGYGR
jgi:hypothetical protein